MYSCETYIVIQSAVVSGLILPSEIWQASSEILKVTFGSIEPTICPISSPILAGEQTAGKQMPMCNACSSRGL